MKNVLRAVGPGFSALSLLVGGWLCARAQDAPAFKLESELPWSRVYQGDPLSVSLRLSCPQSQVKTMQWLDANSGTTNSSPGFLPAIATNWPSGLDLALSRVATNGQKTLLLAGAQWQACMEQPADLYTMLEINLSARLRQFWASPQLASLSSTGVYVLDARWYGTNYTDPSWLPSGGVVAAASLTFLVTAPATASQQASHLERLAQQACQDGRNQDALNLAKQALQLDPQLTSHDRQNTYLLAAMLSLQAGDLKSSTQFLQELMALLPVQDATGLRNAIQNDVDVVKPTLDLAAISKGFRLQVQGSPGQPYSILASTNLQTWTALVTNVATNGAFEMLDSNLAKGAKRFYRSQWVPN